MDLKDPTPIQVWKNLYEQRQVLLDTLSTVERTLETNGFSPHAFQHVFTSHGDLTLSKEWPEIRRKKIAEIFHRFSTSPENNNEKDEVLWSYADHRRYLGALGRISAMDPSAAIHNLHFTESWSMWLHDTYQNPKGLDMTLDTFYKYHQEMEKKYPLLSDLKTLKISTAVGEYQRFKTQWKMVDEALGTSPSDDNFIHALQHLLYSCNETATQKQVEQAWKIHTAKQVAMQMIRKRKAALRLFGSYQLSMTDPDDLESIECDEFLSWMLSNRPRLGLNIPKWNKRLLTAKLGLFNYYRTFVNACSPLIESLKRAVKMDLLSDYVFATMKSEEYAIHSEMGFSKQEMHSKIKISFSTDADAGASLFTMNYNDEGTAHAFLFIDFNCTPDQTAEDLQHTAIALQHLIKDHFEPLIQSLPHLKKWFVTIPPPMHSHGQDVLRIVLLFDEGADVVTLMTKSLFLPHTLSLDTLIEKFHLVMACGVSLTELCTNERLCLGTELSSTLLCETTIGREQWSHLLVQIAHQLQYKIQEQCKERNGLQDDIQDENLTDEEEYLNIIATLFMSISTWLRTHINAELKWETVSLLEFISTSAWIQSHIPEWFQLTLKQLCCEKGTIKELWKTYKDEIENELEEAFAGTFHHVEKNSLLRFLRAYDLIQKHLLGLSSVRIESGTYGLEVILEGMDFINLLPKAPVVQNNTARKLSRNTY